MGKYIDAEKLTKAIEDKGLDCSFILKLERLDTLALIDSLQQEQPIQVNTLTWKDINDLERIINNVHYEFRNGISEKGFGEEVLERFMEERDEHEQPEADLDEETIRIEFRTIADKCFNEGIEGWEREKLIARHFYDLGCRRTAEKCDEIEYNQQRAEESEKSIDGLEEEIIKCWQEWISPSNKQSVEGVLPLSEFAFYARHFAEWGAEHSKK